MNKTEFIAELQKRTNRTSEQCFAVNSVLESNFIFRKKNRPKIVAQLMTELSVDEVEANDVFDIAMDIIRSAEKSAIKRPFGKR